MKRTSKMTSGIFTILLCLTVVVFTGQALAQGGTWETKANMPTARWASAAGVINDTFYVAGGYNDAIGRHLRHVEAYDHITDTWTIKNPRPRVQTGAAAGVVNGILYTVGGTNWSVAIADTLAYEPTNDSWTQKASMPARRQSSAGGVIGGILYVAGGIDSSISFVATLEAYNPTTNSWTTKTQMPTERSSMAAGVVNDILYVVGGRDSDIIDACATLEAYNPTTNSWTTLSPMPTARFDPVAGVIDGILYVVGGRDWTDALATVEAYNPVTDTWSTMDPMPTARVDSASAVINGQLYVAGGYDLVGGSTVGVSTLEVFTPPDFVVSVDIDIKPGSCPNPLNVKNKGVLPVAILGTEDFDIFDIDVASIRLEGISPIRSGYEDVATPFEGEICECHELGADGYFDLTLKFTTQEIIDAIGEVNDGDEVILSIIGKLSDGSDFAGADCVVIIKKGSNKR